jgi:hypothetical protein
VIFEAPLASVGVLVVNARKPHLTRVPAGQEDTYCCLYESGA